MKALLETASRMYRALIPRDMLNDDSQSRWLRFPKGEMEVWIQEYVLPVARALWTRADFREQATWPQRAFGRKNTPEFELVDEIAKAIRESAKLLFKCSEPIETEPILERVGTITISARRTLPSPSAPSTPKNDLHSAITQISAARKRKGAELINVADYLGNTSDGLVVADGRPLTVACFSPYFNAHQAQIGNHVVRTFLARIENDKSSLHRVRRFLYRKPDTRPSKASQLREQASWQSLIGLIERARLEFLTCDDARVRESCMVIVQALIEWSHELPDCGWLGQSKDMIEYSRGSVQSRLFNHGDYRIAERIHQALVDVESMYTGEKGRQSEIKEAIARGGLVVVETSRQVHWAGNLIDVNWNKHRKDWKMLWLLASHARCNQSIGCSDLYDDDCLDSSSTIANRCSRLKKRLPRDFAAKIVPGNEARTYRLDLDSHQVHLISD